MQIGGTRRDGAPPTFPDLRRPRMTNLTPKEIAARILHKEWESLGERERGVLERVTRRASVVLDTNVEFDEARRSFGQRVADRIAAFGGSWPFILIFLGTLAAWIALNTVLLWRGGKPFDPYPYILLNLVLSMVAAIQAPIIMMSQNRQAAKDRLHASHDYEVNLRAEIEIRELHDKLDALREGQWAQLVAMQQEQIRYLERLLGLTKGEGGTGSEAGDGSRPTRAFRAPDAAG